MEYLRTDDPTQEARSCVVASLNIAMMLMGSMAGSLPSTWIEPIVTFEDHYYRNAKSVVCRRLS